MLHAAELGFDHPKTGAFVAWEVAPPSDFLTLLESLGIDQRVT
jgi:hypothetical protein